MHSTSGRPFVFAVLYGMFFIHLYKQSSRWRDVLDNWYRAHSSTWIHISFLFSYTNGIVPEFM